MCRLVFSVGKGNAPWKIAIKQWKSLRRMNLHSAVHVLLGIATLCRHSSRPSSLFNKLKACTGTPPITYMRISCAAGSSVTVTTASRRERQAFLAWKFCVKAGL